MKEAHFSLTDSQFERQFETCSLEPNWFSHEAHLRLAWIHLHKYGLEQALNNIQHQLWAYVNAVGAAEKYNKTVTIAAVLAVHHFMMKLRTGNFETFIEAFPRLKHSFKLLMFSHYKTDIFKSKKAKENFLEPELLPFD